LSGLQSVILIGACLVVAVVVQVLRWLMDLVVEVAGVADAIDRQTAALRERAYIRRMQWEEEDQ